MMMSEYSRALMLIVSPDRALAALAWMRSGQRRCHQKCRDVEYLPAAWDDESEYAIADGSLDTRWAMGQRRKMWLLPRIDMIRCMRLQRCLVMKCGRRSK